MAIKAKEERAEKSNWTDDIPENIKELFIKEYFELGGLNEVAEKYNSISKRDDAWVIQRFTDPNNYEEYFKTTPYYFDTFENLNFELPFTIFQGIMQKCYVKILHVEEVKRQEAKKKKHEETKMEKTNA